MLLNPGELASFYGNVPPLDVFRLRSFHLDWHGPMVTLRVDLSTFPSTLPSQWEGVDVDTVQCHLQFIAVSDFVLRDWAPSVAPVRMAIAALGEQGRVTVSVAGDGVDLGFRSASSVRLGHVSAFKMGVDGTDEGPRIFTKRMDSLRYRSLPATDEKNFHGRI
ncbi:Imm50 family immunity protein [Streptomyces sp. NPDC001941]|uniref:Imm50 family immunity protein n=1 Tax=Streptomyces sp. NPDC001941 TaxID=3154659 RepID=UPI00331D6AB3